MAIWILGSRTVCIVTLLIALSVAAPQTNSTPKFTVKPLPLPAANGLVMLDYVAYDRATDRLWVPAGNLGAVDVIDGSTDHVETVDGFPVKQAELRGKQRPVGPSSVAVGDGVVYIGNRADSKVCTIDARKLQKLGCIEFAPASAGMAAAPDGLIFIGATNELWATSGAPPIGIPAADRAIKIFSASHPTALVPAGKIPLPGSAEGYAVDNAHGRFYTNLEETGQTVAIDVRKHAVAATWRSCDDPSGVAVDSKQGFVFVACTDHVLVLDPAHDGHVVGSISAGAGIDNIDYDADASLLYVAAADVAQLTIVRVNDKGAPTPVAVIPIVKGARSVTAGANGRAYVIDPYGGRILKIQPQ